MANVKVYNLTPATRQKDFYGKAIVKEYSDGTKVLQSYHTDVLRLNPDGTLTRLRDGWSATTGKHIIAFAGLNKKEFLQLKTKENEETYD